jgi:hypothetical protein
MADQAQHSIELVEVKAEDIMAERRVMYDWFITAATWSVGATVVILALMWIFLV